MKEIKHQLKNNHLPKWEVKYLFIGTFNPAGGEKVNYYYGRDKNQTWKLLSNIFCEEFDPNSKTFFELLKKHKIACIDMINMVNASREQINKITGKGYKDSELINSSVKREYNTSNILKLIERNHGINIYTTWGKGSNLAEWKDEVSRLGKVTNLVSPSLAARVPKGSNKFEYMLNDWKGKIDYRCKNGI